ncbi:MAG: OmpA family protein [Variovorax sp.]|nr:MAG: OmpA family protein [Variovorax sp.]
MASSNNSDDDQNFVLGFIFALIALVVFVVVGAVIWNTGRGATTAPAPTAAALSAPATVPTTTSTVAVVTETVSVVIPDGASIRVENGVVNFYFATGSADLAPGAAEALAIVIQEVERGRKAVVSGFHDTTGDLAVNEALARKRAETVRDVLVGLAVPANKIDLKKPAISTGSGNNAEARRVEVTLVD